MNTERYGWEGIFNIRAAVKIRPVNPHNQGKVRPECWSVEGRVFDFTFGWLMGDDDPYPGEIAWIPPMRKHYEGQTENCIWPNNAPPWIASGDLEEVGI